jgi:major vault protein
VAAQTFDYFHKHSADIIKHAVFGKKDDGEPGERLLFSANLLSVTNVDIQSVEPVEQRTRDALQKSVQLAIEIATASQEALANHEAQREEQVAEGRMQRQKIEDQAAAERQRKALVELKAKSAAVESTGQAKAEAIARSEAALIKGKAAVKQAELKAQAAKIRYEAKLQQLALKNAQELEYRARVDELEISKAEKEAKIEAEKFASIAMPLVRTLSRQLLGQARRCRPSCWKALVCKVFWLQMELLQSICSILQMVWWELECKCQ